MAGIPQLTTRSGCSVKPRPFFFNFFLALFQFPAPFHEAKTIKHTSEDYFRTVAQPERVPGSQALPYWEGSIQLPCASTQWTDVGEEEHTGCFAWSILEVLYLPLVSKQSSLKQHCWGKRPKQKDFGWVNRSLKAVLGLPEKWILRRVSVYQESLLIFSEGQFWARAPSSHQWEQAVSV